MASILQLLLLPMVARDHGRRRAVDENDVTTLASCNQNINKAT
jgi:hypothetical protein